MVKYLLSSNNRDSNIELLRILCVLGVIVLHCNGESMGGIILLVNEAELFYWVVYYFHCLCACAVDLFILISGYYMCKSNERAIIKPIKLIIQVMIFNEAQYLVDVAFGREITMIGVIRCLVPTHYFVILYVALFLISPYINILLEKLTKKQCKVFLIVVIILLSAFPTLVDAVEDLSGKSLAGLNTISSTGSQHGYNIINFMLMYSIGALIRKFEENEIETKWSTSRLIIFALLIPIILEIWQKYIGGTAQSYCNPIIIFEAAIWFLLFKRIPLKSRIINVLSKASFTAILAQAIFVFHLNIDKYYELGGAWAVIIYVLLCCIIIYLVSWLVWLLYELTINRFLNYLKVKFKFLNTVLFSDL